MGILKGVFDLVYPYAPGGAIRWLGNRSEYYADATYLVSFPKCGRTWLRVMLGRALVTHHGLEATFDDILCLSPLVRHLPHLSTIRVTHYDRPHTKRSDELLRDYGRLRHKRIILLIRDVRDVLVSMYFQNKKRRNSRPAVPDACLTDLTTFVRSPIGSLDTFLEYYSIWAESRHIPRRFMFVRYEDLHRNPQHELCRVLSFLGVHEVATTTLDEAVRFSSFDNMRSLETCGTSSRAMLKPGATTDPESYKTRRGKVGGFVDYLSPVDVEHISQRAASSLPDLYGYRFEPCSNVAIS
jgi:hypothetical protein